MGADYNHCFKIELQGGKFLIPPGHKHKVSVMFQCSLPGFMVLFLLVFSHWEANDGQEQVGLLVPSLLACPF